ncbi:hypothetical protein [Paenibacillus kribbensis]|nr:hypothetical protein [Paenibacillus kribbensis]
MKKEIARFVANRLVRDAEKASKKEKTLVGALPLPQELKKK